MFLFWWFERLFWFQIVSGFEFMLFTRWGFGGLLILGFACGMFCDCCGMVLFATGWVSGRVVFALPFAG